MNNYGHTYKFITEEAFSNSSAKIVNQGDILYALYGANSGEVSISKISGAINQAILCIRTEEEKRFLFQILSHKKNRIVSTYLQGGQGNLSSQIIKKLKLNFPSLPEQQKIASFLTEVDTKLTQLTKKKALLENYKKGVMQQIFSQELRFKDNISTKFGASKVSEFPDWEEKKLGGIGNTLNGLTGKTKEDFGTGKPFIQYKQIFDSSKINTKKCGLVDIVNSDKQTKVQYGDVFFTTSSETPKEIGTASVLLDNIEEMYLNSFCFGFRVDKSLLYPSFSQFLFRSGDFRKKMIPLAQGSTRYNISKSAFVKLNINLPSIAEQTKIADFLSDLDTKIEVLSTSIENTQTFKKGLLQQLFV
jgi:type I restriction enzyme S subunit